MRISETIEETVSSKRGGIIIHVVSFTNQYDQTAYICRIIKDYRRPRNVGREFSPGIGPAVSIAYAIEVANKIINGSW